MKLRFNIGDRVKIVDAGDGYVTELLEEGASEEGVVVGYWFGLSKECAETTNIPYPYYVQLDKRPPDRSPVFSDRDLEPA